MADIINFDEKMSKKQQSNIQQKAKESQHPPVEDFYTLFIEKRKKYFTQKLEEISLLEKSDFASLKPDQKDKINNKTQTSEKVKYFDEIKQLYFEALAKKGPTPAEIPSKNNETTDVLISDFVNLFSVGQAFHNFEKNSKHIEHVFNSDQMTLIQDLYNSLNKQHSPEQLEESKLKLKSYAENEALRTSVHQFLGSYKTNPEIVETQNTGIAKHDSKDETVSHHVQPVIHHVQPVSKPRLFANESEDEEEPVHQKKEQTNSAQKVHAIHVVHENINEVHSNLLKPLPEGDDTKVDEFKNQNKRNHYNNRNGPRQPRETGDRPQHKKNYEGVNPSEGNKAPEGQRTGEGNKVQEGGKTHEGEQRNFDNRPPRPFNPNYVRREGDFRPHNKEGEFRPHNKEGDFRPHNKEGEFRPHNKEGEFRPHNKEGEFRPHNKEGEFRPHNKGNFERKQEAYRGNQGQFSGQYRERREPMNGDKFNSVQSGVQRNHQKEEQQIQN